MAQELVDNVEAKHTDVTDNDKLKEKRDRNRPPTKIVIRRLPPSMTEETFREQVSPLPEHDYLYFVRADLSLGPAAFSRAYINFIKQDDIFLFKDQYDGYIFVDKTGGEYLAVVEFAPFQRLPKKRALRRKDVKVGTIEEDPMYISFLQSLEDEIKDKENEHTFDYSYKPPENDDKKVTTTPLLEFLKQRRAEWQRNRDEWKEERRKKEKERELEKRKIRDGEKKKRRAEVKDKDKEGPVVKQVLRSTNNEKEGVKAAKDKEGKYKSEKKREDDRPSFKDKYQEGKARDKPAVKTSQTVRPKAVDSRGQRNDERRSAEDLRKKPQARVSDSQDNHGNSRRSNAAAAGDSRKMPSKYRDREPAQGSSRNKDREPRKTGRDYETRKNVREESKKVSNKDKLDTDRAPVKQASESLPFNAEAETMPDPVAHPAEKHTIERRYSLEGDYRGSEVSDNLSDLKPFRRSADNIEKQKTQTVPKFSLDRQELPTKQQLTAKPLKDGKELRRDGKESHKVGKDTYKDGKELRTDGRESQKHGKESHKFVKESRKDVKESHKAASDGKVRVGDETSRKRTTAVRETDKVRRSSLESGNAATDKASKAAPSMRRNHSLEMESGGERSRETSVVSSNDGEDKKQSEDGTKKDPRPERRIRNKDRPSIEIYRPGMSRLSKQRMDRDKE